MHTKSSWFGLLAGVLVIRVQTLPTSCVTVGASRSTAIMVSSSLDGYGISKFKQTLKMVLVIVLACKLADAGAHLQRDAEVH